MVQKEFISDLEKAAGKSNNEILFTDIAKQTGSLDNPWLIFSNYIHAVDQKCVKYMLPKWENKLGGGTQEFMSTHCFAMSEPGRIDFSAQALLQNTTFASK